MQAATIVQLAAVAELDLGHIGKDSTENLPRSYFGEGQHPPKLSRPRPVDRRGLTGTTIPEHRQG